MKTKMHANVCKKKCLAAITAMLMAALLVVPANVKAVAVLKCIGEDENIDLSDDFLLRKDGNEDTGKEDIEVGKNDNMTFVGTLGFKSIKDKIKCFEQKFLGDKDKCDLNTCKENELPKERYDKISLSDVDSTFKVTLTLADGLKFKDAKATLTGAESLFKLKETKIDGQTATITMELSDKAKYTKYGALREDVFGVADKLGIKLTGVQFADNAKADTAYTVTGTVEGSLGCDSACDYANEGKTTCFNFKWTGKRAVTVKYAAPAPDPAPVPAPTQVKPEIEIPYVPSDPVKPVVEEEPKVGKVAKTGEMANTVNQLGLIILAAASVVIAKKH